MLANKLKGIIYAGVSSSTFGLAPFFTLSLIYAGYSSFEALSYRWGVATVFLVVIGLMQGVDFRISRRDLLTVFCLSLFRATTSFSLVIAYQNIASGVASVIHFLYPLAVALAMMLFFKEPRSKTVLSAVALSIVGALFLSFGDIDSPSGGDSVLGIVGGFCFLIRRIYCGRAQDAGCQFAVRAAHLLCDGYRCRLVCNRWTVYRRGAHRDRPSYVVVYCRIGACSHSHFQHLVGEGHKVCGADAYFHTWRDGAFDCNGSWHRCPSARASRGKAE